MFPLSICDKDNTENLKKQKHHFSVHSFSNRKMHFIFWLKISSKVDNDLQSGEEVKSEAGVGRMKKSKKDMEDF